MAGQRATAITSLIQSVKLNGHDPYAYLRDVLARPFSGHATLPTCCCTGGCSRARDDGSLSRHLEDRAPTTEFGHVLASKFVRFSQSATHKWGGSCRAVSMPGWGVFCRLVSSRAPCRLPKPTSDWFALGEGSAKVTDTGGPHTRHVVRTADSRSAPIIAGASPPFAPNHLWLCDPS